MQCHIYFSSRHLKDRASTPYKAKNDLSHTVQEGSGQLVERSKKYEQKCLGIGGITKHSFHSFHIAASLAPEQHRVALPTGIDTNVGKFSF